MTKQQEAALAAQAPTVLVVSEQSMKDFLGNAITSALQPALHAALDASLTDVRRMDGLRRKKLLTANEVQKIYGLNAATLRKKRSQGIGPKYVKTPCSKECLYRQEDIAEYIEACSVRTIDQP